MTSVQTNFFSIFLKIADVNLQLNIQQKKDFLFLKKKYQDYLCSEKKSAVILIDIICEKKLRSKQFAKKSDQQFLLYTTSISKKFANFNDVLLQVFSHILLEKKGLIIHASTLLFNNRGYIFSGPSGAGKSTLRKLSEPILSLSDDIALIRRKNNKYYLYGSPFYQRTKRTYPNKRVLVEAIFSIKQNNYSKLEKLTNYDSFIFFKRNIFSVDDSVNQNQQILDLSKSVNAYQLDFEKNNDFWSLISSKDFDFLLTDDLGFYLKNINDGLDFNYQDLTWVPALVNQSFINKLSVVKEFSWEFEFGHDKKVIDIVKYVQNPSNSGSHTELIKKYAKNKIGSGFEIICLNNKEEFEIIDGNHRAVASTFNRNKKVYKIIYAN